MDTSWDGITTGSGELRRRTTAALLAGGIAIAINTTLLAAADYIPLVTARGGLLKLISPYVGPILARTGVPRLWLAAGLPQAGSTGFQLGFHMAVGFAMALVYGLLLEQALPGPAWCKGLLYAAAAWIANAVTVLPLLGEGLAGSHALSGGGMVYFAAAHTVFFVLLAILFPRMARPPSRR